MKNRVLSLSTAVALLLFAESVSAQDHSHINVGAYGTTQNAQLVFTNSGDFSTTYGYVKTLDHAASGTYAGYYQGNITLTGLAATLAHLGPVSNAPALGSRIFVQIVWVDGPPGSSFAFWDVGATSPTFSLAAGTTGTNTYRLSENDGSPGSDPYGHIHGRRFTTTKPGIYVVGFRALDLSTNGVGGGPIHTPSDVLKVYFQAGVNIKSVVPESNQARVTFGAKAGFIWQLEAINSLPGDTNWQAVDDPVLGDDSFHELLDDTSVVGQRYYRVRGEPYVP